MEKRDLARDAAGTKNDSSGNIEAFSDQNLTSPDYCVPRDYSFSDLLAIACAAMGRDSAVATGGNLKYLQRQRAIPHYATGRGKRASYSYDDVLRSLVGLELQEVGLTPIQIAPIIEEHWESLRWAADAGLTKFLGLPSARSRNVIIGIQMGRLAQEVQTGGAH